MTNLESLMEKAAAGNTAVQTRLGIAYLCGDEDIEVNYVEAFRLLNIAAHKGASRAAVGLALMYAEGLGTAKDLKKAAAWYEAVGRMEFLAAVALARIYSNNLDWQNHALALHWYSVVLSFAGRVHGDEELAEAKRFIDSD